MEEHTYPFPLSLVFEFVFVCAFVRSEKSFEFIQAQIVNVFSALLGSSGLQNGVQEFLSGLLNIVVNFIGILFVPEMLVSPNIIRAVRTI